MKKKYVNPEMEVVAVATQAMLASSVTVEVATGEFSGEFNAHEMDLDDDLVDL